MKKLFLTLSAAALLFSCGNSNSCDTSTAIGAADCGCSYADEYYAAEEAGDDLKQEEMDEKLDKWSEEVEAHMDAGDYTENEVEAAFPADCKL